MAQLSYQNPNAANVTAQLQSNIGGVASDGVTEVRREVITVSESDGIGPLLQLIVFELRAVKAAVLSLHLPQSAVSVDDFTASNFQDTNVASGQQG
jgi:hypothetical protein